MQNTAERAIAIVGAGCVMPDAVDVSAFWENVKRGRYSIGEVTPDRWDPALHYDPDHNAADKTYSKIGGWVREYNWDPFKWHLAIPPRVVEGMDDTQKWAICCTREALHDYGYPERALNLDRTAVILGNAMAGEKHYMTALRVYFPEYAHELSESATFAALPAAMRHDITREFQQRVDRMTPQITEDTMPGELSNCIAGRIANVFNLHGPNYVVDAACASAMAAMTAAVEGLIDHHFDVAITGGVDRNMGASTFVKFCKIGALSATGTRPYAEGADGFVMGEGGAIFLFKRLDDAERDGDKIYAVLRGIAGSSDGKGKGITAPNPIGQKLCIERAWQNAGLSPATVTLMEGHGTSTRVGDVVEVQSMSEVLGEFHLPAGSVALGSVKSNIGHLKSAAGAAGFLKAVLSLRDRVLPPSVQCQHPNPEIDFAHSPLYVNTQLRPWPAPADSPRRAGLSAFGFGGTNFHAVLEEYTPHSLHTNGKSKAAVAEPPAPTHQESRKAPLRGALVIGGASPSALAERLRAINEQARAGRVSAPAAPVEADLRAPERLAIDYADAAELASKSAHALKALEVNQPAVWKALRAQGVFRGHGPAPKVAFLYTGQGSQYVNMLRELRAVEPIVAETFAEADVIMTPLLGKPLSEFIFVDPANATNVAQAEEDLRQTAITQPAVLATDAALTRLMAAYGIRPDMTMGHSLGEYGALVASGGLPFGDALEAVSARGREMTRVSMADNGKMAAVFAPIDQVERILKSVDGYVVVANINSERQAVIGGASQAVERAIQLFLEAGYEAVPLPVSHAFHTKIVAPASQPLRQVLERLHLESPQTPIVTNVTGEFYPTGPNAAPQMLDNLARQIACPVQFVKGLRTLYAAGARVFVEVGPKKALQGFAEDVLGDRGDVVTFFTNHPKFGDIAAFNQALCGLYAAGLGASSPKETHMESTRPTNGDRYAALGHLFADVLDRGWQIYRGGDAAPVRDPVTITGASLGLPGTERIFDDGNVARILRGEQLIDVIPNRLRRAMLDKHVTRLVKSANGAPSFENISDVADVIKLAGRGGAFDLESEFGIPAERVSALDRVTRLAMGAGLDALRDAGIPLVLRYKTTSKGTNLPDRWGLPDHMRDDTGVIFACVFPGLDSFAEDASRYYADHGRREQIALLENLRSRITGANGDRVVAQEIDRNITELRAAMSKDPYTLDRRFLFRVLSMGHSQFAEFIGARGPNTQVNAACASTTQAVSLAEDWIHSGRCRRVIVIAADDITSDHLIDWFGAGFLASGAAATDAVVEESAVPFDRRRHGMIMGMGAAALVVESERAARERGIQPICEVLSAATANSAFHGTRLNVEHIGQVMEGLVAKAETACGVPRQEMARKMVFVSHETYTPARGGSASAEIFALRKVFGAAADQIVIANTKGFTGHAMGVGIEDVVAVKALETGCVPPVANFKEVDPELGLLNLSKGGIYPIEYALRLGAGFGSQISMTLTRRVGNTDAVRPSPERLGYAYRIADGDAWNAWLGRETGGHSADLEVVHRTLRMRDAGRSSVAPPAMVEHVPVTVATSVPVIVAAPVPVEAAAPPVTPAHADPVKDRILALVVEKTGYPPDMLDLDLDLEADLGVDTVKQAELMAAVREIYDIPRDENLKLRDFSTLARVIQFVKDRRPETAATPTAAPAKVVSSQTNKLPDAVRDSVKDRVLALVVEKTGYPPDMLDLDLDLEADLGVDTVKQAEMLAAVRGIYDIPRDENLKLHDFRTLSHVIQFVHGKRPDLAGTAPPSLTAGAPMVPAPTALASSTPVPASVGADIAVSDSFTEKVLKIVAEKTGYPKEMLDLELDLEADLGIDTVKQAEMFASVRATFDIPRDQDLKLRDFPTLAHVIQFARERASKGKGKEVGARQATPLPASFEATDAVPRRVPVPELRPPLAMCKQTGVTLGEGRRVVVMPDEGGVSDALTGRLEGRGVTVLRLDRALDAEGLIAQLETWLAAGPVQGVYWLPALDYEGDLDTMELGTWREALRVRLKSLYVTMKALYDQIAPTGTFLLSATRLGGRHGYSGDGASAPMGGAVTGFTKTYKWERLDALVKAVDFEAACTPGNVADILIDETQRDPGAVEIGHRDGLRWTIGLREESAADGQAGMPLNRDTVFLITGAAGSIVSAITADLASASGGTFYLLDLVSEPDPHNPDLDRLTSDKAGLKKDLFARIQARGERATPALVEKELAALERAQAARSAIEAVRAAGGTAHYFSVNLTDADAVGRIIDQIRQRSGRIDVLLHAAGMERSHYLKEKTAQEFDQVFDVKSDGWFNLLHSIGSMPLGAAVAFSSIAARFGNGGQTDYSSANDLLCKMISSFGTTRPETRGIAIDWTAWATIGMATRGSIPKMMELAGIDMLPPEAGVPVIRRELTSGGSRGEVLIGQRLGVLLNEWDATGGLDIAANETRGPMLGTITAAFLHGGLTFETTLDPSAQPFLNDHRIEGVAVLPGVMGMETFAEAAQWLLPGWHVAALEDVNFLAPFKYYRDEPRALTVQAVLHPDGDDVLAECRLLGYRTLPNHADPQATTHFTARVRLAKAIPVPESSAAPGAPSAPIIDRAEIYRLFFHGPAYRVVQQAWRVGERFVGQMAQNLPVHHYPEDRPVSLAPRVIELCFQTAGLWEMSAEHRMGLPQHLDQVCLCRAPELAQAPLHAVVTFDRERGAFDAEVVDASGNLYVQMAGYRTVAFAANVEAESLKQLQR